MAKEELATIKTLYKEIPYEDGYVYWCGVDLQALQDVCEDCDQTMSPGEVIRALEDGLLELDYDKLITKFDGQTQSFSFREEWGYIPKDDGSSFRLCARISKMCGWKGSPSVFVEALDRICQEYGYIYSIGSLEYMAREKRILVEDNYITVYKAGEVIAEGYIEE